MTTQAQAKSLLPERINGSPIDYGRGLLHSDIVDNSRFSFVLARLALSQEEPYADIALRSLHESNTKGVLQPPLSESLANEIEAFLDSREGEQIGNRNFAAAVLLSMALDEGTRPLSG